MRQFRPSIFVVMCSLGLGACAASDIDMAPERADKPWVPSPTAAIWPVTVTRRIDSGFASLLRRIVDLTGATSRSRRNSVFTEAVDAMGEISRDVELAGYESSGIGPSRLSGSPRASERSIECGR